MKEVSISLSEDKEAKEKLKKLPEGSIIENLWESKHTDNYRFLEIGGEEGNEELVLLNKNGGTGKGLSKDYYLLTEIAYYKDEDELFLPHNFSRTESLMLERHSIIKKYYAMFER